MLKRNGSLGRVVALSLCIARFAFADVGGSANLPISEYATWAKCKIGTAVIYEADTQLHSNVVGKRNVKEVICLTLIAVNADRVTIESVSSATIDDRVAEKEPFRRQYDLLARTRVATTSADKAVPKITIGEEVITVGGKKYACKTSEVSSKIKGVEDSVTKSWCNADVPGGVVKSTSGSNSNVGQWIATLELKEIKLP